MCPVDEDAYGTEVRYRKTILGVASSVQSKVHELTKHVPYV